MSLGGGSEFRTPIIARWGELDRRDRRRKVLHSVLEIIVVWMVLFTAYYAVPFTDMTAWSAIARLVLGLVLFVVVLLLQLRRIRRAELPVLQAVQALGVTIPIFLLTFAIFYLSLSTASVSQFSEPLDHTGSMYLVITTFSTVGFGDITPERDFARILVSLQMLLDLIVLGAVVRLLARAARTTLESEH